MKKKSIRLAHVIPFFFSLICCKADTNNSGVQKDINLDLSFSNNTAAIILAVIFGITIIIAAVACYFIFEKPYSDFHEIVETSLSSLTALLVAATGLSTVFLTWPQAQQNAALGVVVIAQITALGWMNARYVYHVIPRAFDTFATVVATLTVITTSHAYTWKLNHDPNIYCYIAWALLSIAIVFGLTGIVNNRNEQRTKPGQINHIVINARTNIQIDIDNSVNNRIMKFACSTSVIGVFVCATGITTIVFASFAANDMVKPYTVTMIMGIIAVGLLSIFAALTVFKSVT